jgi:replicative DNA helicase
VRQEQLNTGDKIAVARRLPFGNKQVSTDYSIWLGCMVSDGGCTSRTYTFTNFDASIVERFRNACRCLNGQLKIKNCHDRPVRGNYRTTGLRQLGIDSKIDGKSALTKTLPDEVFSWDRASVAWLLRAMYGCDGCFSVRMIRDREQCAVVYSTSSRQLSLQVRDLLLKFGLVAKIGQCNANYKGQIKRSWQVKLSDAGQITTFIQTIGFLGKKQTKCHELLKYLLGKTTNRNVDTIPSEVWPLLLNKFTEHGTSYYMCRRLMRHGGDQGKGKEGYCGTKHKDINRRLFKDIAELLKDEELRRVADEEVVWDRIISIEPVGVVQTYDVAMPKWHNFVVGGLITHNTNTMMNIGLNIYEKGHNVLFVPLEMNRIDLAGRIVSNRAKIEFNKMAHPRLLSDEELLRIKEAKVWLNQNHKFAILDVSERTSVESLRRQIEKHAIYFKPDLVVIDYIALMEVDKAQRNDLAIGEILKNLRFMGRRYGFHIMSAAQIGRAALMKIREEGFEAARPDSTALRGSHEYSADSDSIFALFPNPEETNKLKVFCIKARWGKSGGTYHLTIHPSYCQIYSEKGTKDIATESFEKSGVDIQELNIPASQVHAEMLPDLEWAHADIGEQKVDDLGLLATSEVKAPADDFGELGKAAPQSDDDLLNMIG